MTVIEFLDIWLLFLSCMYLISEIIEFIYIDFNYIFDVMKVLVTLKVWNYTGMQPCMF